MLVDSHCHLDKLDLTHYDGKLTAALDAAAAAGVGHILCVGIDLDNIPSVLRIAEEHPHVSASVGVHPMYQEQGAPTVEILKELADNPNVIAIGETGLDYYYNTDHVESQQLSLRNHIAVARELNKPLIIHTRDARKDTIDILRNEGAEQCGGVMHCFTESYEMACQALDLGFYISFSGIVTFKSARELQEVARKVPLDRILVETDAPWLAPVPFRGKTNEPAYVKYTAQFVADLKGVSFEELATQTSQNFSHLFKVDLG